MKKTLYYTIQYLKDKDDYVEENGIKYKRLFIQNNEVSNLLDYITNLEKSNARLKEENFNLTRKNKKILHTYARFPMSRFMGTDKIREKIKCPQLGSIQYGEWGALPLEVRYTLFDLCELIESQDYKSRLKKIEDNCKKSIESINKKLENNKEPYEVIDGKLIYLNEYQVVRLKAIRMKCKELLNILGGDE